MKQFQLQLQEQEQKYQQLAKEHTRLKQENKKLTNSIPQDKGNKLEELLIDLSNELMDNSESTKQCFSVKSKTSLRCQPAKTR